MKIESINNKRVKYWSKLYDKKFRDLEGKFLIEGDHLINEAIKNNYLEEIITVEEKEYPVKTFVVNESIIKKISNQKSIPKIMGVCKKITENPIKGKILVLDNIQDPGNLGTIIRSALAFNFCNIILTNNCVDLYNDKVIRSSEGMIFHLNIVRQSLNETLEFLKAYYVIGTDVNKGKNIKNLNINDDLAIIIGSEGKGISKELFKICSDYINIPINENCESLNASVAASIIMYELRGK